MEAIVNFHNYTMVLISFIVAGVIYLLVSICIEFAKTNRVISHKYLVHGTFIETI
jgi:heme/copper-type cytochrome/quinol oxidase subunit 2